jgi:hypothetical protein
MLKVEKLKLFAEDNTPQVARNKNSFSFGVDLFRKVSIKIFLR